MERQAEFKRNEKLEALLGDLNDLLGTAETRLLARSPLAHPPYPVILIVSAPRSGSTLLLQWLANTGSFAYPSNLLARFYAAPAIGARIQQLLADPEYRFRDELFDITQSIDFVSSLGKTRGALSPNEFWYFWRRFFAFGEMPYLDEAAQRQGDVAGLAAELAAVEMVFHKPFAMKGLIMNWNIPYLAEALSNTLFLHIKRHPLYATQSLLEARERYFGDRATWYSFKPREYERLKDLTPEEQVVGQIYFTNQAIEAGLASLPEQRYLKVDYEAFCAAPGQVFNQLRERLGHMGYAACPPYAGPEHFDHTDQLRVSPETAQRILTAYQHFSGVEIDQPDRRGDR
jgi:hypothetical protein